jgi:hypothetical protein
VNITDRSKSVLYIALTNNSKLAIAVKRADLLAGVIVQNIVKSKSSHDIPFLLTELNKPCLAPKRLDHLN